AGTVRDGLAPLAKDASEECTNAVLNRYQVQQLCKDDFEKLCAEKVKSGATSMGQCVKDNDAKLSDKCRAALVKGSKQQKVERKTIAATGKPAEAQSEAAKPADKPATKKRAKKK